MGKRLNSDEMQKIFEILQKSYDIFGPKNLPGSRLLFRYRYSSLWFAEQLGKNLSGIRSQITVLRKCCFRFRDNSLFYGERDKNRR